MPDTNLVRFRSAVEGALAQLEARRAEVNDLNVFPVADGDTGDNMALTLRAVLDELDALQERISGGSIDDIGREEIVDSVARAALLGARGNSGVILSQLIRGAAEELISRPGELVDPILVGAALARAADRAYASVRDPAEGTILTVIREMAGRIASEVAHMPDARLDGGVNAEAQNEAIAAVLERALETGQESVDRGPELLPVLREAGVVDAGGYAVLVIFSGIVAALRGAEPPPVLHQAPPLHRSHPQHHSSTYRYCTNFAVIGSGLDPRAFITPLEQMGDSVLCVGDAHTLKVHLHTDDPESATALFEGEGDVSRLDVADMHEQVESRSARLAVGLVSGGAEVTCGALAVTGGDGLRAMFEDLGVRALDGGPTMNPSTYDVLAGIHDVAAEEVIVLPNSPNVVMAAERAAQLSDKSVHVVATHSQQAGLVAAIALDPARGGPDNVAAMAEALEHLRTGGVAEAARDDPAGRFSAGDAVGYADDELIVWGEPKSALRGVLSELAGDAELITCIAGADPPIAASAVAELAPDGIELEQSEGGQKSWWWLLAAE